MRPAESFVEQPVRSLQTMLRVLSRKDPAIPSVIPDGIYGQDTVRSVTAFQQLYRIPVTGITDQRTWETIVREYDAAVIEIDKAQPIEILLEPQEILRAGDSDPYVYLLQSMLTVLADSHDTIETPTHSGYMDPQTVSSLQSFQLLADLPDNGEADRITWRHLVLQFTLDAHKRKATYGNRRQTRP